MRLKIWIQVVSCLLFLGAGFCHADIATDMTIGTVDDSEAAKDVRTKTAKQLEDKYDFEVLMKDIKKPITKPKPGCPLPLVVGFRNFIDIPQARKYIVEMVGMYAKNINDESSLESVFKEFPVTYKSITVVGVLFNEKVHKIPPGILWSFCLLDGVIQYYVFDTEIGKRTVAEESYEEAVRIVDKQMGVPAQKKEALWVPEKDSDYYSDFQDIEQKIKDAAEKVQGSASPNWQLCKTDSAFLVKAALSNLPAEIREKTNVLAFTPIPFIPASLGRRIHNCLVGTKGYVPLLDTEAALAYIQQGVSLGKNSLMITNWEWDEKSAIYNSILIVELSKKDEGSQKP